jgi:hypothetical protein
MILQKRSRVVREVLSGTLFPHALGLLRSQGQESVQYFPLRQYEAASQPTSGAFPDVTVNNRALICLKIEASAS